jgi:hypothetical protein
MISGALWVVSLGCILLCWMAVRKARQSPRRWVWGLLLVLFGGTGILAFLLGSAVWIPSWSPFMDDGPFKGLPRTDAAQRRPSQTLEIYGGFTLDVFDPEAGEIAPTVRLRRGERTVWAVYAAPDARSKTHVDRIRFTDDLSLPFLPPRVRGWVDWTYGHEVTWWHISRDGELEGFWYSW